MPVIRDVLLGALPPATFSDWRYLAAGGGLAAGLTVEALRAGAYGVPAALGAALACFTVRMLGVRYDLNAPMPLGPPPEPGAPGTDGQPPA